MEHQRKNFAQERQRYDFAELKDMCDGRWAEIIPALSTIDISNAIVKLGKHFRCHNDHGNTNEQFRLYKDFHSTGGGVCNTCGFFPNGFLLLSYLNGYDTRTAVKEVADYLREQNVTPRTQRKVANKKPEEQVFEVDRKRVEQLQRTWSETTELEGTRGEAYLRERGLTCDLPDTGDVRFHPELPYYDEDLKLVGYFPAIVSLLRSCERGYPLTIHRIYLDPTQGKAKVPQPKKLMSVPIDNAIGVLGAAIRLYKAEGSKLAVTEGIETAMAVRCLFPENPVWATFSAQLMKKFIAPPGTSTVLVFGDVDASGVGQAAAATLALRLAKEGVCARLILPVREVSIPDENSGWFNKEITKEKMIERLEHNIQYKVVDSCKSKDWLDHWQEDPVSPRKRNTCAA